MRFIESELEKYTVKKGDLLVCEGGDIGRAAIWDYDDTMCIQNHLHRLRAYIPVCTKYFLYSLMNSKAKGAIKGKGIGLMSLSANDLHNIMIALPPLTEQQRIVTEIEHWFALINQIEQCKADLRITIKQTKSKILDLAIHGKLVPQDPNDEPAIELLKRINPDFAPCDNGHYPQLPKGWTICKLEQVANILDNLRKPINSNERNSRIKDKQIDRLYPYYGATGQVGLIDDYVVDGHYLLLGEDGAPFLDKNAIKAYSISGKSWVNNHAHILSPKIDFEFLQYSLNQIDYSEYVNGSTRLKLTQTDMRSIKLMLPPLVEQKLIKDKIRTLFSQLDMIMESL